MNIGVVIVFREIGKGNEVIINFARCMNMKCFNSRTYNEISKVFGEVYEEVAAD